MAIIKCPGCGATNLDTGKGVRCEYCSSYLDSKAYNESAPVQPAVKTTVLGGLVSDIQTGISKINTSIRDAFQKKDDRPAAGSDPWTASNNKSSNNSKTVKYDAWGLPVDDKYTGISKASGNSYSYKQADRDPWDSSTITTVEARKRPVKNTKLVNIIIIVFIFFMASGFISTVFSALFSTGAFDNADSGAVTVKTAETYHVYATPVIIGEYTYYDVDVEFEIYNSYSRNMDVYITYELYSGHYYIGNYSFSAVVFPGSWSISDYQYVKSDLQPTYASVREWSYY